MRDAVSEEEARLIERVLWVIIGQDHDTGVRVLVVATLGAIMETGTPKTEALRRLSEDWDSLESAFAAAGEEAKTA